MSAKHCFAAIAIASSMGLLAACGQGEAPAPSATSSQPQQSLNPASPSSVGSSANAVDSESASLTVSPNTMDGCKPNEPIVATVSWHSKDPHVKVMVDTSQQASPKLFSEGGYTGQAKTGNWVTSTTRFTLIDADTGKQLAQTMVTPTQCK